MCALETPLLKKIPLFAALGEPDLKKLGAVCQRRHFKNGAVIFYEEDVADHLFVIETGEIKVTMLGDGEREVILSIFGPGECFGELALLDEAPRSATVVATADSTVLAIARDDFHRVLLANPTIALHLLKLLAQRLRKSTHRIESLVLLDVFGRVARQLLETAHEHGTRQPDGSLAFPKPTQQDLASMVGSSRETVSRVIKELSTAGLVRAQGGKYYIYPERYHGKKREMPR